MNQTVSLHDDYHSVFRQINKSLVRRQQELDEMTIPRNLQLLKAVPISIKEEIKIECEIKQQEEPEINKAIQIVDINQAQPLDQSKKEGFELEIIREGKFNIGGVRLEVDFDKKMVRAIKKVKTAELFQRELAALKQFNKNSGEVSLKLIEYNESENVFCQEAGFINFHRIYKIVKLKNLQNKYTEQFEFFILKQLLLLLYKLKKMHSFNTIAHGDIKPNNIVIGFEFLPYFIDFGGAINIEKEPESYLSLCTPIFIMKEYLMMKRQFTFQEIKDCDKLSLMLTFLFLLCRNKNDENLFCKREYAELINELKIQYSSSLLELFQQTILKKQLEGIESCIERILDNNLVKYINDLHLIEDFLKELKQFEYNYYTGEYLIKEWDQFNENVIKMFPEMMFELDLLEISQNMHLYQFFQNINNNQTILVDINKPFYQELVKLFVYFSNQGVTHLRINHLEAEQKLKVQDVINLSNGGTTLTVQIDLNEGQVFSIQKQNTIGSEQKKRDCFKDLSSNLRVVQINAVNVPIDKDIIEQLLRLNKIEILKIKCKDLEISLFSQMISQLTLSSFNIFILDFQYKIQFPIITPNQLVSLKTNLEISNLVQVIESNRQSLKKIEIVITDKSNSSFLHLKSLLQLQSLMKLSLRVKSLKQQMTCQSSRDCHQMSDSLIQVLEYFFNNKSTSKIKLYFEECNLNIYDAQQLDRIIKSSSISFLKLKIVQKSKPVDQEFIKIILSSIFYSRINKVSIFITNKPPSQSFISTTKSSMTDSDSKGFQLIILPKKYFQNNLKKVSLSLSSFSVNICKLLPQLSALEKFKIVLQQPQQIKSVISHIQDIQECQSVIIKSSQQSLDKQLKESAKNIPQRIRIKYKQQQQQQKIDEDNNQEEILNKSKLQCQKFNEFIHIDFTQLFSPINRSSENNLLQQSEQHCKNPMIELVKSIEQNSILNSLFLDCTQIFKSDYVSEFFLSQLFASLSVNKSIQQLKLSVNGFKKVATFKSIENLNNCLKVNHALLNIEIDLSNSDINDIDVNCFSQIFISSNESRSFKLNLLSNPSISSHQKSHFFHIIYQSKANITVLIDSKEIYNQLSYEKGFHSDNIKELIISQKEFISSQSFFEKEEIFQSQQNSVLPKLKQIKNPSNLIYHTKNKPSIKSVSFNPNNSTFDSRSSCKNSSIKDNLSLKNQTNSSFYSQQEVDDTFPVILHKENDSLHFSLSSMKNMPNLCNILGSQSISKITLNLKGSSIDTCFSNFNSTDCLTIVTISTNKNKLSVDHFSVLCSSMLKQKKLEDLHLSFVECKINQSQVKVLLNAVKNMVNLTSLSIDFSNNQIHPAGANHFQNLLEHKNLQKISLNLNNTLIGLEGVKYIYSLISSKQQVNELNLGLDFNYLGTLAIEQLNQTLNQNKTLKKLTISLQGNQIEVESTGKLKSILEGHSSIEKFKISFDNFTFS